MNKQVIEKKDNSRDYLAIGAFLVVLLILITSVVYLIQTGKKDAFDNPFKIVSRWMSDYWHEGKRFIEGQKGTWSPSKKEKEMRKHLRTGHSFYRKKMYRMPKAKIRPGWL